ncbi:MAG: LPS assembly lipoprotein LptE [Bacteroidota bacterium]
MRNKIIPLLLLTGLLSFLLSGIPAGCGIYKLNDASVPDSIKTVKVNFIENRASYVNPQLSPRLTDKLRQKIIGQTRLTQTNAQADWEISGTITQYAFSTSAISGQQVATNRLTVGLNITINDVKANKTDRYDISRSFEFRSNLSFQQAENSLGDEMIRTLTDEIFNRIFSKW